MQLATLSKDYIVIYLNKLHKILKMASGGVRERLRRLRELKGAFARSASEAEEDEAALQIEHAKVLRSQQALLTARNALSLAQEEIDASALPPGAQALKNIQRRDTLALEVSQEETRLDALQHSLMKSLEKATKSKSLFHEADVALMNLASSVADTEAILEEKKKMEQQRYGNQK